jgi:hypothetical protein
MNRSASNPSPTLPPLLEEFRIALRDEIEVAKRNASSSAIPLTNGQHVGAQGSAHQYAFQIDSVLNTPDGAPGDLVVPGKPPMEATIVSVEGLRIVVSVEVNLGRFVPTARLQTNLTILMRKLIQRIEENSSVSNTAAERMLGMKPVEGSPFLPESLPSLNEGQRKALGSALGHNLTFIWGPPGTGKTYTIGTIAEYLHNASRSVLLVSHTNIAVDQAIRHVADALKQELSDGAVIRVGEVKDEVLESDHPEVLLKNQIEIQSSALVAQRATILSDMQSQEIRSSDIQRDISCIEWIETTKSELTTIDAKINEIAAVRRNETTATKALTNLENNHSELQELRQRLVQIIKLEKNLISKQSELGSVKAALDATVIDLGQWQKKIEDHESRIEIANRITPLREERSSYATAGEQRSVMSRLASDLNDAKKRQTIENRKYEEASAVLRESQSKSAIGRVFKRLPNPDEQQLVVDRLALTWAETGTEVSAIEMAHDAATKKLARMFELDGELFNYKDIATYQQEVDRKFKAQWKLDQVTRKKGRLEETCLQLQSHVQRLKDKLREHSETIDGDVKDVYDDVSSQIKKIDDLKASIQSYRAREKQLRNEIRKPISRILNPAMEWIELEALPTSAEEASRILHQTYNELSKRYTSVGLESLRSDLSLIRKKIQALQKGINEIDAKLAQVEHEVINNAAVVGATLIKAYLSDDIQGRKFDTVVLDEASMAPIPALWAAALLSEKNLIIVGDFKQLPPIVMSENKFAKRWLGNDVFEESRVKERWENNTPPPHFVPLTEQRRMLPAIASVANYFYNGILTNGPIGENKLKSFDDWYVQDWPHDDQVVLVDTGPLNAWVTSVTKGGSSSRLNFLSGTVSVDLAEQLLSLERTRRKRGAAKRILIVSPYRPHAKLVNILLRDLPELQGDVVAGTAHSFQGSEADVVIFDTVVDEPHWRVNLFMPGLDEDLKRLFNVGLTRGKFRLFILGDFDYCQKLGKKAFLGKTLLPYLLKNFPRIDARRIVPNGLAARAAKAQMTMLGGKIDPETERLVVTQEAFYRVLSSDLSEATEQVVIYSPSMTLDRVGYLAPQLQAAIDRGVAIYVVTKSHSDRKKSELPLIGQIEAQLSELGIVVIHKLRMHEKLVFIDDDITWSGSLNPLSFSNTQEIMERRKSKAVFSDFYKVLRTQDLIEIQGKPESRCPICGDQIVAAEGADQPFYWRCKNNNCFSRSINQPYPFDGVLTCRNCGAPVSFGDWGGAPHWRCTKNKQHRQKIYKAHLRLPKMASLVPRKEIRKICKLFEIESFNEHVYGSKSRR